MTYWILQANPNSDDGYRVFDALSDAGGIRTWRVVRYRRVIEPGDEFALWASGPERGIYAFGIVTEPAAYRSGDDDSYWKDPAQGNRPAWRIGIRIDDVLLDSPILHSELSRDPDLANAAIVRMPGGGNPFPVTDVEWQAIRSHRAETSGQQVRTSRNPPWTRDELILALDVFLRRRPQLPGGRIVMSRS